MMNSNNYQILIYDNDEYADSPLYFLSLKDAFTSRFLNGPGICQLLYQLDEWYGNTEQKTKDWALEYQLWARMILSLSAPAIMINPHHILITDVLDEIVEILGSRIGCDKEVCDVYKDMVCNADKLALTKPQDDVSFAIQWPPAFDAVLLEFPKPDAPTIADYIELAKLLGANKDEQLLMLYVEGDGSCAYGLMRNNTADGACDYFDVARREGKFQNAVREVLNNVNLKTENGEYVLIGVRTKLFRKFIEKE